MEGLCRRLRQEVHLRGRSSFASLCHAYGVVDSWLGDEEGTLSTVGLWAIVKEFAVLRLVVAISGGLSFSRGSRTAGGGMFGFFASSLWPAVVVFMDRLPPQRLYLWHSAVVQAEERNAMA